MKVSEALNLIKNEIFVMENQNPIMELEEAPGTFYNIELSHFLVQKSILN